MTTYATMRSRIEDEIYDATITSSVNSAILTAIAYYERRKFWFNQKTGTFATVNAQEYYSSSDNSDIDDIIEIKSMVVSSSSIKTPIYPIDFDAIDRNQTGSDAGLPTHFAYFNEQIRLYPIPDAAYTVTFAYHYRFPTLSADGDSNPWTTDAEELIRTRAKRQLALHKLWDAEMYARLQPSETEAFDALQSETARRMSNFRLRTDYPSSNSTFDYRVG